MQVSDLVAPRSTMRARIAVVAPTAALPALGAVLAYMTVAQGAFWWPQMAAAALLACVAAVLVCRGIRFSPGESAVGIAVVTLATGLLVSAAANGWPNLARGPAATLVIAAACALLASRIASLDGAGALLTLVTLCASGVALVGIVGLATHTVPLTTPLNGTWRLSSMLTYSNAAGAALAMALPAAIVLTLRDRRFQPAAALIAAALAATVSRGGIVAAVAGLIVLVVFGGVRLRDLLQPALSAAVIGASLLPAVLWKWGSPETVSTLIVALGVPAGLALASLDLSTHPRARRVVAASVIAGVLAIIIAIPFTLIGSTRLNPSSSDRTRLWSQTWDQAVQRPVFGTGPGTYMLAGSRGDDILITRYAHNEYLQVFAETGLVGIASVLIAFGLCIGACVRARPARNLPARGTWAAAVAGCAAFGVHSFFDFIWRVPAIVAVAFVLCVVAIRSSTQGEES